MKKTSILTITISSFSLVVSSIALGISINNACKKEKTADEIFNIAKYSIAELKSTKSNGEVEYGTAVLVSDNGFFATNAHLLLYENGGIVKEYNKHYIRFAFEEEYHEINLYKYNYEQDIAYLKIDENIANTKPILISESKIQYGDTCYAVGNGMNHGIGISKGTISIPLTTIVTGTVTRDVIQCDLAINSGNSGGALLNSDGELIGITSFRMKANDGSVIYGTSYCIPYSQYLDVLNN